MRRFITAAVGTLFVLVILVSTGSAQLRRPVRPAPVSLRPPVTVSTPFSFSRSFTPPTLVRGIGGTFNPATGAFAPSTFGPYVLTSRRGFEPLNGTFTPTPSGNFLLNVTQSFNPATNTFVPSTTGNFVVRTRGDFVPNAGAYVRSATGSFDPRTGAFMPGASNVYSLSTPSRFVPTSGTFVPSANGFFVLSAKEAFNPATGGFVPSPTGPFQFQTRGNFVPEAGVLPTITTGSTGVFNARYNHAALQLANYYNTTPANASFASQLGYYPTAQSIFAPPPSYYRYWHPHANPYLFYNPYLNPYAYANPYAYPYSNPYLPPTYSYPSTQYASPYAATPAASYGAQQPAAPIPAYAPNGNQPPPQTELTALGIPNDGGAITWPLALRTMPPDKKRKLLDPLDAQLQVIAKQGIAGRANPAIVREAKENIEGVYRWLRAHRLDMSDSTYRDADGFLSKLDRTLQKVGADY